MLIRYTHGYSLPINIVHSVAYLVLFWVSLDCVNDLLLIKGVYQLVMFIVGIVAFIPVFGFSSKYFSDPLGTYCYCRLSLGITLSWSECVKYSPLFSYGGNWYPMIEIRQVPEAERKEVFIKASNNLLFNNA